MFKPCPNCGFLVALIAGRETSQRCPRCGSALVSDADPADSESPARRRDDLRPADRDPAAPATDAGPSALPAPDIAGAAPADAAMRPDRADRANRASASPAHGAPYAHDDAPLAETAAGLDAALADAPPPDAPAATATDAAAAPALPAVADGPSFMRRSTPRASHGRRWPWAIALVALALLLSLQLVLAQRTELARDATWRPLVLGVCGVVGCDVAPWREPRAFAMISRGVRPQAGRAGVLHATATVRNDARWAQPAPVVVLSLADVDGRPVGARAVAPREYGHDAALVAPGESLDIAFDVREPSGRVESFDFQLR